MRYKLKIPGPIESTDVRRAYTDVCNKYGKDALKVFMERKENKVVFDFDGTLESTLYFIEYLLESSITLDTQNFLIQDGVKTKTKLELDF